MFYYSKQIYQVIFLRLLNMTDLYFKTYILNYGLGNDEIKGNISFKNIGAVALNKVSLFNQHNGEKIQETFTNKNGDYVFENILLKNDRKLFLISHDSTAQFNGVIADNIGGQNVDS